MKLVRCVDVGGDKMDEKRHLLIRTFSALCCKPNPETLVDINLLTRVSVWSVV